MSNSYHLTKKKNRAILLNTVCLSSRIKRGSINHQQCCAVSVWLLQNIIQKLLKKNIPVVLTCETQICEHEHVSVQMKNKRTKTFFCQTNMWSCSTETDLTAQTRWSLVSNHSDVVNNFLWLGLEEAKTFKDIRT